MTRNKHVKQLVRARMEKTGERYTAARRHVVAEAPPPGGSRAVSPGDWHQPGTVPGAAALRIMLAAAGVRDPRTGQPFTEAMTFGLAGGIGIGVFGFVYDKADFASLFIGGRHLWQDDDAWLRRAAARLGVPIEVHEGTPRATDAALREILASGRPATAFVEAGLLPHRQMPEATLGGGYHLVTVYAMDGEQVLVGDLAAAPDAVPLDAFAEARKRIRKNRNRVVALARTNAPLDLATATRDALAACVAGLDGADAIGGATRNFSLDGLHDLARKIGGSGKDSWAATLPPGRRLWSVLSMLVDFVESRAPGLCRPMFADFLAAVDDIVPGAAPLGESYRALGRRWTGLAEAALPRDVPAFGRAWRLGRELVSQRSAGRPEANDRTADIRRELAAIGVEMADCFPLDAAQYEALRATLHDRVGEIHQEEMRLQQELRQLLRVTKSG
ncbi:MAG: DUF4872 domain-containing protein [Bauldia sp.]|nr:DUF4872 domain-containing protein [Bauldia sp.]MCW5719355.1 DUF4872 domain-containing protein [Bauldia sp.]